MQKIPPGTPLCTEIRLDHSWHFPSPAVVLNLKVFQCVIDAGGGGGKPGSSVIESCACARLFYRSTRTAASPAACRPAPRVPDLGLHRPAELRPAHRPHRRPGLPRHGPQQDPHNRQDQVQTRTRTDMQTDMGKGNAQICSQCAMLA